MRRLHIALGTVVCLVVPLASYAGGTGGLAYTMFADVQEYRVEVVVIDDRGERAPVGASQLAVQAQGTIGNFLAGAERFRMGPAHRAPRRHLDDLAARACETLHASAVEITLVERDDAASPERSYRGAHTCAR
jgi:hypothetical protein